MLKIILLHCLICVCVGFKSRADMERLYANMTANYNKYIRPGYQSHSTNIRAELNVVGIKELDERSGRFTAAGLLNLFWNDERIRWDKATYGYVDTLNLRQDDVWRPDLSMSNPFSSMKKMGYDEVLIKYDENGWAVWQLPAMFDTVCDINVKYYPFDVQTCSLKFISLGYPPSKINLQPGNPEVNLNLMSENSEWVVVTTSIANTDLADHASISMEFQIKRRYTFFLINIFSPLLGLTLLSSMVFFLPAESGERVGYSIACLLAIMVYLTLVAETLPKSSAPIPNLGIALLCSLVLSTIMCILTILGLRIYHMDTSDPIPRWVVSFLNICCRSCKQSTSKLTLKSKIEPTSESIKRKLKDINQQYDKTIMNSPKLRKEEWGHVVISSSVQELENYTWTKVGQSFDIFCFIFSNCLVIVIFLTYVLTSNAYLT